MKDRVNQLFKDKLILVTVVLGLVAIVAAAGVVSIQIGDEYLDESPYLQMDESDSLLMGELEETHTAGDSNAEETVQTAKQEPLEQETYAAQIDSSADLSASGDTGVTEVLEAGAVVSESLVLNFTDTDKLQWPVMGNVILGYSMDTTTWFPTLEQYKCNPANVIQSEVSTPVAAPADARIMEVGYDEEIGNYVRLDLGNEYTAVCGQLQEIQVVENEYLHKGELLGYVAEPTKYYSVEGTNLYFEVRCADTPVDALDYLE